MNFQNKNVIITGGANGIGLSIAKNITAAGGNVCIFDKAANSIGARYCITDVTSRQSLENAFNEAPIPDVVIINAGIAETAALTETSTDLWSRTLAVNLTGAFDTIQIAAKRMIGKTKGSIVITASTNSFDGEPNLIAYNASKAGLLGILRTAANELGPWGIRVNAVCPGLIRTQLTASAFSSPAIISDYFKHVALGRGGEPDEVAQAVMFLASDLASYITGATLVVDGGQTTSKFGTWGNKETDHFDGQRWNRSN